MAQFTPAKSTMSDHIFTILEQNDAQDAQAFQPSAPMIGWGIALLCIGIWIGKQLQPQPTSASTQAPSVQPSGFTQALQWVSYGKEFERQKQYEDAIAIYDQGLEQHPNHFRLWHERGLAFAKLQQFEAALESFDHAYQLCPKDGDLAHERGDTLLQLERYEDAIASFDIYLRYHPDNSHVLTDRSYALCQLGRFDEALRCLNRVLKNERSDRETVMLAHFYQIEALRHSGQLEAALQSVQQAMTRYPGEHFATQQESTRQQIAASLTEHALTESAALSETPEAKSNSPQAE